MNLSELKIYALYLVLGMAFGAFLFARFAPIPPQKQEIKTDVVFVDRIIKKKDGTIIVEKIVKQKQEVKIQGVKNQYHASLFPTYNFQDAKVSYGVSIEKRIIGNLFLGVNAISNGSIGLSLSLDF